MYHCFEVIVEFVLAHYFVSHGHPERFHGMAEGVVVGADHLVEVINHILFVLHHSIFPTN